MPDNHEHIARLIFKRFNETLTADEEKTLVEWANSDDRRAFMNSVENSDELIKHLYQVEKDRQNNTEALLFERISSQLTFVNENYVGQRIVHRVHFLKTAWFRYAAAIILLVAGVAIYYLINKETQKPVTQTIVKAEEILPGSNRAILTLSTGEKIALNNSASETITDGDLSIKNNGGQLSYNDSARGSFSPFEKGGSGHEHNATLRGGFTSYNTMSTPIGGQYQLTLSDGTKVWLNAASSITYPTIFTTKTREVKISGEAYFEVKSNSAHPFIVKTNKEEITVLGTEFNVNTYENELANKTSLINGSIKINNKLLQPGQAFTNGKIIQTNISKDIAWKNGYFSFEDADIQTVMRQISRWYNVEVIYRGKIPETEITGDIGRSLNLSQVLKVLKNLRINYTIEKNKIIIHP
jgi:transmembrane sensor